ncbi:MAG TPA: hemerythrin domain-containing protein [Arachnia sp.]|nr:hemerythrin domain-containing protein [Arachnia sp.]HMT85378.1 hemerythrin domain-containing protein [Arachnia sp.]
MPEGEQTRLVAWADEMSRVHVRLRDALRVTRQAVASGTPGVPAERDLLLFCHGFCTALAEHHVGEDTTLFPAIEAAHPELRDTLRKLQQDHSMISFLLQDLQSAVEAGGSLTQLDQHLEGIAAIMESHFRYEERTLLGVLATLELADRPTRVFGSL